MISRSNYEIFFIDYFDGKLDKIREEELFAFLKRNTDLHEEFNRFSDIHAEPDLKNSFVGKDRLKKETITLFNYKTWLTGYIENDLTKNQKNEVEIFLLKNPVIKPELEILKQSILIPDRRIIFDKKNILRKGGRVIHMTPAIKRILSVAAALLIFMIAYFIIQQVKSPQSIVAGNQEKKENKISKPVIKDPEHHVYRKRNTDPSIVIIAEKKNKKGNPELAVHPSKSAENKGDQNIVYKKIIIDSLQPAPLKENREEIAEKPDSIINLNDQMIISSTHPSLRIKQMQIHQNKLSEIFDDDDMKDLGIEQKKNTETILELASDEFQKISKSAKIKIEKQSDNSGKSVTYALGLGKSFSISHTTVR